MDANEIAERNKLVSTSEKRGDFAGSLVVLVSTFALVVTTFFSAKAMLVAIAAAWALFAVGLAWMGRWAVFQTRSSLLLLQTFICLVSGLWILYHGMATANDDMAGNGIRFLAAVFVMLPLSLEISS